MTICALNLNTGKTMIKSALSRSAKSLLMAASLLFAGQAVAQDLNSDQPIAVEADSMEVLQEQQIATFIGNVVVIQGTMRLQTDKLVIAYDNTNQASSSTDQGSIRKIDAYGNVVVVSPTETAKGDKGVYDVAGQFITLTGNVILTQGENIIRGNRLVMNLATGKSQIKSNPQTGNGGRVKGIFTPGGN